MKTSIHDYTTQELEQMKLSDLQDLPYRSKEELDILERYAQVKRAEQMRHQVHEEVADNDKEYTSKADLDAMEEQQKKEAGEKFKQRMETMTAMNKTEAVEEMTEIEVSEQEAENQGNPLDPTYHSTPARAYEDLRQIYNDMAQQGFFDSQSEEKGKNILNNIYRLNKRDNVKTNTVFKHVNELKELLSQSARQNQEQSNE